jgi:hypothetical protein
LNNFDLKNKIEKKYSKLNYDFNNEFSLNENDLDENYFYLSQFYKNFYLNSKEKHKFDAIDEIFCSNVSYDEKNENDFKILKVTFRNEILLEKIKKNIEKDKKLNYAPLLNKKLKFDDIDNSILNKQTIEGYMGCFPNLKYKSLKMDENDLKKYNYFPLKDPIT